MNEYDAFIVGHWFDLAYILFFAMGLALRLVASLAFILLVYIFLFLLLSLV